RLGRPGQRGGGRGRPAHVPPAAADQRHPARRGAPRPHRRAGAGHGPAGGGPALRGAPDPGRGVSGPMTTTSTTGADLVRLTAVQMADGLAAGDFTSEQLVQAHLDRIERLNPALNVFLHIDAEGALATAREVDRRRAAGEQLPRLAGVPVAVKDIVCTEGIPTTAGSRMLQGWIPPYDATVARRLKDALMPILGKTNMDEFAMGSSTEHSAYGPTRNPWDLDRIPGGSGGGSSAAVAAFLAPLAIGSDTGGSIRQPAAVTGTVGAKP